MAANLPFVRRLSKLRWAFHVRLTSNSPWSAIGRFLKWQVMKRVAGPGLIMVVSFVDETRLLVSPGMSSSELAIYWRLFEFEDMSFVLHMLTDDDLFADVGSNVGAYCVLASGVRGAKSVAMEPVPTTIDQLRLNIAMNKLEHLVEVLEIGVSAECGELNFSTDEGGVNHVVFDGSGCRIPVRPLDKVFAARTPTLLKIDAEGFETNVIKGAQRLLKDTTLKAVLMEMMGCGNRYGFDERVLDNEMREFGFDSFVYDPFNRKLAPGDPRNVLNTIYVRDLAFVEHRLRTAQPFLVLGHRI